MKYVLRYLVFCAVALIYCNVTAQKHDYIWFGGYSSHNGIIDSNRTYGITKLNFNFTPVEISHDSLGMSFMSAPCIISDKDGNLLVYSNGNYIANKWDVPIENSDSLSYSWLSYVGNTLHLRYGQFTPRSNIAIPRPDNPSDFLFFNLLTDTLLSKTNLVNCKLYGTIIDVEGNFGLGEIKEKKCIDG